MGVILIGYRGSGKSTVGQLLSQRLNLPFIDTDQEIIHAAGKSIAQIFEQDGEPFFRELEQEQVWRACLLPDAVISLGGGAVLRAENRRAILKSPHRCFYFRCEAIILAGRIESDSNTTAHRPHLSTLGGGLAEIEHLLAIREPLYREAMTAEIDVTELSPEAVAAKIASQL